MSDNTTYQLSRPIVTHTGTIAELPLKYPTAKSYIDYGMPYTQVTEGEADNTRIEFKFNPKIMFKFISDMSGLDDITLSGIDARDVVGLFWHVVGMLNNKIPPTSSM